MVSWWSRSMPQHAGSHSSAAGATYVGFLRHIATCHFDTTTILIILRTAALLGSEDYRTDCCRRIVLDDLVIDLAILIQFDTSM